MTHHVMLTVGDTYNPAYNHNTFRRAAPKYAELKTGDTVEMRYVETPDGEPFVTEDLEVCSVVRGPLYVLLDTHAEQNHALTDRFVVDAAKTLFGILGKVYDDLKHDEPFVVVIFG